MFERAECLICEAMALLTRMKDKAACCRSVLSVAIAFPLLVSTPEKTHAQAVGILLQNNLMPASGGMGVASIARPQDVQSALEANPATLSQRKGTQFSLSGSSLGAVGSSIGEVSRSFGTRVTKAAHCATRYSQFAKRSGWWVF
ncbi:MAG: hypothetical protein VYA84_11520 [Planctomycetota bacterium]|nr:hypothetical protein [Planctomycetota bacterium]